MVGIESYWFLRCTSSAAPQFIKFLHWWMLMLINHFNVYIIYHLVDFQWYIFLSKTGICISYYGKSFNKIFYMFCRQCEQYFSLSNTYRSRIAAAAKSLQSCPTLCDPIDGSPPGSPVPGILQARTLEWVAISFSSAWKWKVKLKSLSRVRLLATP